MSGSAPQASDPQASRVTDELDVARAAGLRRLNVGLRILLVLVVVLGLGLAGTILEPQAKVLFALTSLLIAAIVGCLVMLFATVSSLQGMNARQSRTGDERGEIGEFVATLSHELRTPLSVILGYTDLILDSVFGQPSADEVKALHRIRHQSMQLLDLMQGILDLNRLEARGLALSLQDTTVRQLLLSVQESIPETWARPGVRLEWVGLDDQSVFTSDRIKVEMILRNLIHNALKYTERGSVCVSAAVPSNRGVVELTVADSGSGIAKEDLPKVFDMYVQGRSGPRGGGVGLGLYIVKRLTEALGGRVSVESEEGVGTRFVLTLPREPQTRSVAA